jgi:hypothetical protein
MIDTEKNFNKEYLMRNILIVLRMLLAFPAMACRSMVMMTVEAGAHDPYGSHQVRRRHALFSCVST